MLRWRSTAWRIISVCIFLSACDYQLTSSLERKRSRNLALWFLSAAAAAATRRLETLKNNCQTQRASWITINIRWKIDLWKWYFIETLRLPRSSNHLMLLMSQKKKKKWYFFLVFSSEGKYLAFHSQHALRLLLGKRTNWILHEKRKRETKKLL